MQSTSLRGSWLSRTGRNSSACLEQKSQLGRSWFHSLITLGLQGTRLSVPAALLQTAAPPGLSGWGGGWADPSSPPRGLVPGDQVKGLPPSPPPPTEQILSGEGTDRQSTWTGRTGEQESVASGSREVGNIRGLDRGKTDHIRYGGIELAS